MNSGIQWISCNLSRWWIWQSVSLQYYLFKYGWQITFVTFNRFCPISKNPFDPPFLNRQYQAVWNDNQNLAAAIQRFLEKCVLKICGKFTEEHPCWSGISIKLLCNFIEIAIWHGCSPVNLLHIFRTTFPKNTSESCFWKFNEIYKHVLDFI